MRTASTRICLLLCRLQISISTTFRKSCPTSFFHSNNNLSSATTSASVAPTSSICIFQISAGSAPFKVNRIWPLLTIQIRSLSSRRLVETQASTVEQEVIDEVVNRLISAVEPDPVPSKETCAAYIEKLCRSGNLLDVVRLLRNLHENNIFLGQKTYNIILTTAAEKRDTETVSQIFKDLLLTSNILGPASYSNVAKAFLNIEDSGPLLKFIGEVSQMIFPESAHVINRIICSFGESGQIDKALAIYGHMKNLKCKPDLVTYNTVVHILGQARKVDEMLHEFAVMKEAGITPDLISYNTLINSLWKMGRLDVCIVLLQEMGGNGICPDLWTYTALIDSFGRVGRVEEALRLFDEMKKKGISPSLYNYRALINNLKKGGKLEAAVSLLEEMNLCDPDLLCTRGFKKKNR